MANLHGPLRFGCGIGSGIDRGIVIALSAGRSPTSSSERYLMEWTGGAWRSRTVDLTARAMAFADSEGRELLVMGEGGHALVLSNSGIAEERVDASVEGPSGRGNIRGVRLIGSHLYAVGMGRQVYRRVSPGIWMHWDAEVVRPVGSLDTTGFSAIDGREESDLYAVGMGGEIWHRDGRDWHSIASPTNVILQCVRAVAPGLVYACGQQGVLLRGSPEGWEAIGHSITRDDLWGMEWFGNRLYVASAKAIFRLDGDDLERVDTGLGDSFTYCELHASDGAMWSFGAMHVARTDGQAWMDSTPSTR